MKGDVIKQVMVTVVCPSCRRLTDAPAGSVLNCPRCGVLLSVPKPPKGQEVRPE